MKDKKDLPDRKNRALVNGISILYGVAREMVTTVTSRSAHGQMLLPTLNFNQLAPTPAAAATAQAKSAPRKNQ